jgi:peptidoglycan hydrolase-like protein with peptidoglycan-binding domain
MAITGFALSAHAAGLTSAQISAIESLVASFGADSATIANVNAALTGTAATPVNPGTIMQVSPSGGTSVSGLVNPGTIMKVSPNGSVCHTFTHTLSVGSTDATTGGDVTALQGTLIQQGLLSGSATGYFGPLTAAAVMKFQTQNGVSAVGMVGPTTRGLLGNLCMKMVPPPSTPATPSTTTTTSVSGSSSIDMQLQSADAQLGGLNNDLSTDSSNASQTDDNQ